MDIDKTNYPEFQRNQQISVELSVFPSKVIQYFEYCLEGPILKSATKGVSTYSAKLETATGSLSIIESTDVKPVVHIKLPFVRGNDQAVKDYLASRLALALQIGSEK